MANDIDFVRVGDHCAVISGFAFKSNDLGEIGIPVVKIKNVNNKIVDLSDTQFFPKELVNEKHEKFFIKNGDVLIAMTGQGSVGRVGRLKTNYKGKVLLNQRVGKFSVKPSLDLNFLYYVLSSEQYENRLFNAAIGSGQPNLSPSNIYDIEIPYVDIKQQKAIAHILGSLDDKIELNRQMNETLEAMAQALFKSWFVDFDPVINNALAAGNAIPDELFERAEQRKGIQKNSTQDDQAICALFTDSFEYSEEMGWIPKEWSVKPLDYVADYLNGLAMQKYRPENIDDDYLPVVKIAQLREGVPSHDEKASTNIKPEYIIDNGDVIFSWSGSLLVDIWCAGKAALNQHLFKVTSDKYPKWFYLNYTKHHLAEFQRIANDKAVTMGHIKRSHLKEALCTIPEDGVYGNAFEVFENILDKQISLRIENQTLSKLRDTLLPKLMSGEIRISDATAMVDGV